MKIDNQSKEVLNALFEAYKDLMEQGIVPDDSIQMYHDLFEHGIVTYVLGETLINGGDGLHNVRQEKLAVIVSDFFNLKSDIKYLEEKGSQKLLEFLRNPPLDFEEVLLDSRKRLLSRAGPPIDPRNYESWEPFFEAILNY